MLCRTGIDRLHPVVVVFAMGIVFVAAGEAAPKKKSKTKSQPAAKSSENSPPEVGSNGKVVKTEAEWRKLLTREQFRVTRLKDTETAFQNAYWNSKKNGSYQCICCQQSLFDSQTKFDSGTGWPSFWTPVEKEAVAYHEDRSGAELRTEVLCSRCDAHLGHVFSDGPAPTGLRYCVNSAALKFVPRGKGANPAKKQAE